MATFVVKMSRTRIAVFQISRRDKPQALRGFGSRFVIGTGNMNVDGKESIGLSQGQTVSPLSASRDAVKQEVRSGHICFLHEPANSIIPCSSIIVKHFVFRRSRRFTQILTIDLRIPITRRRPSEEGQIVLGCIANHFDRDILILLPKPIGVQQQILLNTSGVLYPCAVGQDP